MTLINRSYFTLFNSTINRALEMDVPDLSDDERGLAAFFNTNHPRWARPSARVPAPAVWQGNIHGFAIKAEFTPEDCVVAYFRLEHPIEYLTDDGAEELITHNPRGLHEHFATGLSNRIKFPVTRENGPWFPFLNFPNVPGRAWFQFLDPYMLWGGNLTPFKTARGILENGRFFNVWAKFGGQAQLSGASNVNMTAEKLIADIKTSPVFQDTRCEIYLRAGAFEDPLLVADFETGPLEWTPGENNGELFARTGRVKIVYETVYGLARFTIQNSVVVSDYLLRAFRHYFYANETELRTTKAIGYRPVVSPVGFYDALAKLYNTTASIILRDHTQPHVFLSNGVLMRPPGEWLGKKGIFFLPATESLQKQSLSAVRQEIQRLEHIDIEDRTVEDWEKLIRLAQTMVRLGDIKHIRVKSALCASCAQPPRATPLTCSACSSVVYCSDACAAHDWAHGDHGAVCALIEGSGDKRQREERETPAELVAALTRIFEGMRVDNPGIYDKDSEYRQSLRRDVAAVNYILTQLREAGVYNVITPDLFEQLGRARAEPQTYMAVQVAHNAANAALIQLATAAERARVTELEEALRACRMREVEGK